MNLRKTALLLGTFFFSAVCVHRLGAQRNDLRLRAAESPHLENYVAAREHARKMPARSSGAWKNVAPADITGRAILADPTTPATLYLSSERGGILRSADGGASWSPIGDLPPGALISSMAIDEGNPDVLYAESASGTLWKSVDRGLHWESRNATDDAGPLHGMPFAVDPHDSRHLWMGNRAVYHSSDGADTWLQASPELSGDLSAVAVASRDSNRVAAGASDGHIYVNGDALRATPAAEWASSQPRPGAAVSAMAFDPARAETVYAAYSSFKSAPSDAHVYRSVDGGLTWTGIDGSGETGLPDVPVNAIAVNPSDSRALFAATDLGVYSTTDGGAHWNREDAPFGDALTSSLRTVTVGGTSYLYALTVGKGAWRMSISAATGQFPNLSINKSHSCCFYQGLQHGTYTILVSNSGPAATSGDVKVTETLPSALTPVAMTGNGWTCSQPSGPCTESTSLPAGQAYQPITVIVNVAPDAPASVENTSEVTGGGDSNLHFGLDPTDIEPSPNLSLSKNHSCCFYQGQTGATYIIRVSNSGPGPTTAPVTVTESLPAGMTATSMQGTGWNCSQPSGPCTRNDVLNAALSYPAITLTVNIAPDAPASVTNSATLSGGGDANTHTANDATNISPSPNLSLSKSHSCCFYQGQTGAKYTMTVSNSGPGPTTAPVTVTESLPAGMTATSMMGQGWNCSQPSGPCTRNDVLNAALSYPSITLTVNIAPDAPASVINSATLSGGGDANTHTANDSTNISASPNLSFRKSHSCCFSQGQSGAVYTMTVSNSGPGPTTAPVTVSDSVPSGLTAVSISGQGWNCTQPSGPCSRSDVLNAALSYPVITLTVNVDANAPSQVTNTATLSGGGDANSHTSSDATNITGGATPNLTVTKTHSGNFSLGETAAAYSILVANNGQGPTSGPVSVTDNVPSGLTATSISGSGWSCTQPAGPCTRSDVLQGGVSYPVLVLSASVSMNAPASLTNTVTVSCCNQTLKSGTDVTNVVPVNLSITKTHSGNFTPGQTGATFTITVTNSGQGPVTGTVTVTDAVPAGLTATSISGGGWNCTQPAGPCTRNDALQPGSNYPAIVLSVNVAANAPSTLINTATVTCCTNVTKTASDTVNIGSVSLDITKTHTGNFTPGQTGAVFTITVSNNGQVPTSGIVSVTDIVPNGLTATSISGAGWSCLQPAGPCTRSDVLQGGATYPVILLSTNVSASPPPSVTNTATVTCCTNVTKTATDTVVFSSNPPVLKITKSHTGNFTLGQTGATYTLTVSNAAGAGPTSGAVTVTDTSPRGLTLVSMAGAGWTCTAGGNSCTRNDTLNAGQSYPAITVTVNVSANASDFALALPRTAPSQNEGGR